MSNINYPDSHPRLIDSVGKSQEFERVLDIGAGVGHLSRYLSYNYRLQVLFQEPKFAQMLPSASNRANFVNIDDNNIISS